MSIYSQDTPPQPQAQVSRPNRLIALVVIILLVGGYQVYSHYAANRIVETMIEDMTITHNGGWSLQDANGYSDCAQFEGTLLLNCTGAFERGTGLDQTQVLILRMFTFTPGDTPGALGTELDSMLDAMDFSEIDRSDMMIGGFEAVKVRFRHDLSMARGQMVLVKPTLYAYFILEIASGENENYLGLEREMNTFIEGIRFTGVEAEATQDASGD